MALYKKANQIRYEEEKRVIFWMTTHRGREPQVPGINGLPILATLDAMRRNPARYRLVCSHFDGFLPWKLPTRSTLPTHA
jgi:hypothetical protein